MLGQTGNEPLAKSIENIIWSVKYTFDDEKFDILHEANLPSELANITCNTCAGSCYISCGECSGEGTVECICCGGID